MTLVDIDGLSLVVRNLAMKFNVRPEDMLYRMSFLFEAVQYGTPALINLNAYRAWYAEAYPNHAFLLRSPYIYIMSQNSNGSYHIRDLHSLQEIENVPARFVLSVEAR